MIISEELKRGFYSTADFWKEQAEGKLVELKRYWHRWEELKNLNSECAFCEKFSCPICPLKSCMSQNGFPWWLVGAYFEGWALNKTSIIRRYAAIRLWWKIKKWMKENLPEYFERKESGVE